jgi:ferredoxin
MADVEINFEREGLEGIIPVGTYIGDAMRRLGVKYAGQCTEKHDCVVTITSGEELLSPLTLFETEHFASIDRKTGERLACHAKIERSGEIIVMTRETGKEEPKIDETEGNKYRKEFSELPLEQKISELVKLEAIAFGDTVSYIVNSPYAIFEKIGDVMASFGMKLETKARNAQRPAEHSDTADNAGVTGSAKKPGKSTKKGN